MEWSAIRLSTSLNQANGLRPDNPSQSQYRTIRSSSARGVHPAPTDCDRKSVSQASAGAHVEFTGPVLMVKPASRSKLRTVARRRIIKAMGQVHMTEAEAARDFHAVLARVREGSEVVIEEGHRRIALIKAVEG